VTAEDLLGFLRGHKLAVEASVSPTGDPQAAVIGIVVSDRLELFFDTLGSSRKAKNLRRRGLIALVVGWDLAEAQTAQVEGIIDEPTGADLDRLKALYFADFPDGRERERDPDIAYFRVRPTWVRYSDFRSAPPTIVELEGEALTIGRHSAGT
jgi:general stress protein 26